MPTLLARSQAGSTYYMVVDGYGGASGLFTLSVTCTSCPEGQVVTAAGSGGSGSTAPAASDAVAPAPVPGGDGVALALGEQRPVGGGAVAAS